MVDNNSGQIFYVKNVINKKGILAINPHSSVELVEPDEDLLDEDRDSNPRGSLNLDNLGWDRQIVEQFIVTD